MVIRLLVSLLQIIRDDLFADVDTLTTDEGVFPSYQFKDISLRFAAERAAESLVRARLLAEIHKELIRFHVPPLPALPVSV